MSEDYAATTIDAKFSHSVISFRGDRSLSADELHTTAAAIRQILEGHGGRNWGVYVDSPFLQVATLIALQSLDRSAVLLPHAQPDFITGIACEFDGLLLNGPVEQNTSIELPALEILLEEGRSLAPITSKWQQTIGLMTSGSSGKPTQVIKTPAQVLSEVGMLETAFGHLISGKRVFHGTTSHQHLFGFTFRVMWPLFTGRAFSDTQIRFPGEVSQSAGLRQKVVLISSPAFLSRARPLIDLPQLSANDLTAFSSGGPLDTATAVHFNQNAGITLVEIYGSTETGALASRVTRSPSDTPWLPLPGVEVDVDVDGILSAQAPHLPNGNWYKTEDRVALGSNEAFTLLGRKDRIVKVADKRVSLTELERLLIERPEIDEARVFELETGILGAVLIPAESGWTRVREIGKHHFLRDLRDHLSRTVERVTTPKRWRLLKHLPVNAQGKTELTTLTAAFFNTQIDPDWRVIRADA
ncbi:MAG: hypothetical protein O7G86_12085, partial [Gammaproteobacteria bacterium]|nr:hypothetical protein [Gammaproteobacteria bacterium]